MNHYFDLSKMGGCVGIFADPDDQVIYTGLEIHLEPAKYRDSEPAQRLARENDLHFWFDDETPPVSLYAVPRLEIGGYDSQGGLFAGSPDFTLRDPEPLYYIDQDGKIWKITNDSGTFLQMGQSWRNAMAPTDEVELFPTLEAAREKYHIHRPENDDELMKLLKGEQA